MKRASRITFQALVVWSIFTLVGSVVWWGADGGVFPTVARLSVAVAASLLLFSATGSRLQSRSPGSTVIALVGASWGLGISVWIIATEELTSAGRVVFLLDMLGYVGLLTFKLICSRSET
jgi:hypothetical protein